MADVLIIFFSLFIPFGLIMIFDPLDKYRRWKHPKWFEYFDSAKKDAFELSKFLQSTCFAVEEQHHIIISLYQNKRIDDEQFSRLSRELCYAFDIFQEEYSRRKDANDLLVQKAHEYAVKNNLKWGLLYEDKSTEDM